MSAMKRILLVLLVLLSMMANSMNAQKMCEKLPMAEDCITRYSVIEVYPEYLDEYLPMALEVGDVSMRTEPGVIAMYPTASKEDSCKITILEIYASQEAYKSHIASEHFQKYKQGTLHMVKSLQLLDQKPLNPAMMLKSGIKGMAYFYPDSATQQKMLEEEGSFLARMKPGLQHAQMLAVKKAIQGDDAELQQIRESRNQAPQLPEEIKTYYPTRDICLFSPKKDTNRKRPVLIYLHGGGWCFGSINSCARFCAAVALESDCMVAALNYRLAPAHPFPAPLDDIRDALSLIKIHADEWGVDTTQIAVGGDSAGGNLALAAGMSIPGIARIIPIYPVTKLFTEESPSWKEYGEGYGNDAELLEVFNEAYANGNERNPLVSVGLASDDDLKALPSALFISAGHDILLDQTEELVRRMENLGLSVNYHIYPTATHLFITVPGQPTAFSEAVKTVSRFLNEKER